MGTVWITMMPDIEIGSVAFAGILIIVMFVGMRLMYGYWPWQRNPYIKAIDNWRAAEINRLTDISPAYKMPVTSVAVPIPSLQIVSTDSAADTFERSADAENPNADKF